MATIHILDTIDYWLTELDTYNSDQLLKNPAPNSWSIGQVYRHLIDEACFHLEQSAICLQSDTDSDKTPTPEGQTMLTNNTFPDIRIDGPMTNVPIPQYTHPDEIRVQLKDLKDKVVALQEKIKRADKGGKTKHPGLGYFTAQQWLQFSDMHFRHHLRQKNRIDQHLGLDHNK